MAWEHSVDMHLKIYVGSSLSLFLFFNDNITWQKPVTSGL